MLQGRKFCFGKNDQHIHLEPLPFGMTFSPIRDIGDLVGVVHSFAFGFSAFDEALQKAFLCQSNE